MRISKNRVRTAVAVSLSGLLMFGCSLFRPVVGYSVGPNYGTADPYDTRMNPIYGETKAEREKRKEKEQEQQRAERKRRVEEELQIEDWSNESTCEKMSSDLKDAVAHLQHARRLLDSGLKAESEPVRNQLEVAHRYVQSALNPVVGRYQGYEGCKLPVQPGEFKPGGDRRAFIEWQLYRDRVKGWDLPAIQALRAVLYEDLFAAFGDAVFRDAAIRDWEEFREAMNGKESLHGFSRARVDAALKRLRATPGERKSELVYDPVLGLHEPEGGQ